MVKPEATANQTVFASEILEEIVLDKLLHLTVLIRDGVDLRLFTPSIELKAHLGTVVSDISELSDLDIKDVSNITSSQGACYSNGMTGVLSETNHTSDTCKLLEFTDRNSRFLQFSCRSEESNLINLRLRSFLWKVRLSSPKSTAQMTQTIAIG